MKLRLETILVCDAGRAWSAESRIDFLNALSYPFVSYTPVAARDQDHWETAGEVTLLARLFGVISVGRQTIRVVSVDEHAMALVTEERGGPIRRWRHKVSVCSLDSKSCRYRDDIEFDAGYLSFAVWILARLLYGYRHHRRKRLLNLG